MGYKKGPGLRFSGFPTGFVQNGFPTIGAEKKSILKTHFLFHHGAQAVGGYAVFG
jgi:hypothetical protein